MWEIRITDYFKYRINLRNYDLTIIKKIIKYSEERYLDSETGRNILIGNHKKKLVLIAYEMDENTITPVTIHATTRQQIKFRIKTRRFVYE